ncbi:MAG TPA: hypothetical protein DD381_08990 [Lentisphaeria bacterium]|nr:MAG: hypothetical protein A2X47_07870 [Lentisphaerae bacterium GWF2_38_69]HBM16457.1 hypothetical protein [Lentisphaeria bacterium]
MDIKGKKILITGAAVRIGREIAIALAMKGASIVIHCFKSRNEASRLLQELDKFSSGNELIVANLSNYRSINQKIFPKLPDIDILINNAASFYNCRLLEEDISKARRQFELNFWAPYFIMKEFRNKRDGKDSLIINILDYRIKKPAISDGTYLITKDSLHKLTKLAALQWAPKIRVNAVAPGFVIPPKGMENSNMDKSLKKVPLGKPTALSSIASACVFLTENDAITGQTIYMDGGASL